MYIQPNALWKHCTVKEEQPANEALNLNFALMQHNWSFLPDVKVSCSSYNVVAHLQRFSSQKKTSCQSRKWSKEVDPCQKSGVFCTRLLRQTTYLSSESFHLSRAQSFSPKWTAALLSEHRRQFSLGKALTFNDCHFSLSKQPVNTSLSHLPLPVRDAAAHMQTSPRTVHTKTDSVLVANISLYSTKISQIHLEVHEKIYMKRLWEKAGTSMQPPSADTWCHILTFKVLVIEEAGSGIIYSKGNKTIFDRLKQCTWGEPDLWQVWQTRVITADCHLIYYYYSLQLETF